MNKTHKHSQGSYCTVFGPYSLPFSSAFLSCIVLNRKYKLIFSLFLHVDMELPTTGAVEAVVALILWRFGKGHGRWSNTDIEVVFGSWKILIQVPLHLKRLSSTGLLQSKAAFQRGGKWPDKIWASWPAEPFCCKPHCKEAVGQYTSKYGILKLHSDSKLLSF